LFYHSINALPDVTALSMMLCGLLFFVKWENNPRFSFLLICILCLTLAGLSKMQFASAYVFALTFALMKTFRAKTMSKKQFAIFFISAVVSMGVIMWWYAYARELQNNSGLHDFVIQAQPLEKILRSGGVLLHNLISDIPELLLNYSSFILLLVGVFFIFRQSKRKSALFVAGLCWLLSLMVFHIVELPQMEFHNYYMLVELPVLILMVAYAAMKMHQKKFHVALLLLLLAQPVLAATRIIPSRWMNENKSVPKEFLDTTTRAELESATPPNELCIVGPDNSGCIFFYFMHKKGFGFADKNDLLAAAANGKTVLENNIAQGAKYFITNDAGIITDERFHPFFLSQEKKVGNFYVMRLNANNK
jgi:hypothetical protein